MTMEGYNNSYQNSSSARETEFQRLAQNIGTNIQKIQQSGKYFVNCIPLNIYQALFSSSFSFINATDDNSDRDTSRQ